MKKTMRRFTIRAADLTCDAGFRPDSGPAARRDDAIQYRAEAHDRIAGRFIFYGPYIHLEPGVYLLTFEGQLDGPLILDFACSGGKTRLKTLTIGNFADPVCLVLTQPAPQFEVRGATTASLQSMRLESISVDFLPLAAEVVATRPDLAPSRS